MTIESPLSTTLVTSVNIISLAEIIKVMIMIVTPFAKVIGVQYFLKIIDPDHKQNLMAS